MSKSLRDTIDAKFKGRRWKSETLPVLGLCLWRSMVESERGEVESAPRHQVKRLAIIHTFCDPTSRQPVYDKDDLEYLGTIDGAIIDKMAAVALSLSELSEFDIKSLLGEPDAS